MVWGRKVNLFSSFRSSTNPRSEFISENISDKKTVSNYIVVVGVSHIKAMLNTVLKKIEKLEIDENTAVFLEPKKSMLLGYEDYNNKAIGDFFKSIVFEVMKKRAKIIPLNPKKMPSHESYFLFHKYACQLAEEEYMANIINKMKLEKNVVIVGNIHAERIYKILSEWKNNVLYINASPLTPDDIIAKSWRNAVEGKSNEIISLSWLDKINSELQKKFFHEFFYDDNKEDSIFQELFWEDESLFEKYINASNILIKKNPVDNFKVKIEDTIKNASSEIKEITKQILNHYSTEEDHLIISYNSIININNKVSA